MVYLVGAGLNQHVKNWHGLSPPMNPNFFQVALQMKKFSNEYYIKKMSRVYDYIKKIWKKDRKDLLLEPFDIEELFTILELQAMEAENDLDKEKSRELFTIQFMLKSFIGELLSDFTHFASTSDTMRSFGEVLYEQKPTIMTFNYDCMIEEVIESASGVRSEVPSTYLKPRGFEETEIPYNELPYSHFNWNRPLGYGLEFAKVQLHRAGVSTYVDGDRFYSHPDNKLYDWSILKLHGSLNWFRYLPLRKYPQIPNIEQEFPLRLQDQVILVEGHWWFAEPPDLDGWIIDPIIITPVLYKSRFYNQPLFEAIWTMARKSLLNCKKLVVVGYSFSPTDFSLKKLMLEVFSGHEIDELIVVNPNTSVVQIVKELCHFNKPVVVCKNLDEYLRIC